MRQVLTFLGCLAVALGGPAADCLRAGEADYFETHIRPVLVQHCQKCHSGQTGAMKGGLALDSAAGWKTGGDSGAAIVPGKPEESLLLDALRYNGLEMPPSGKLPDEVIAHFETWIKQGAVDPRTDVAVAQKSKAMSADALWSLRPVTPAAPPVVKNVWWGHGFVDEFVLAGLEQAELSPSPDVEPGRWVRRVSYQLTGLPPDEADVAALRADPSPRAREAYVDRLLAGRAFAEHWARHWLDVARYADSNGGDFNATFHEAYRYRNYVIDSVAADKPLPQFIREQIAGDLLPADTPQQREEQLVATGFLMFGPKMLSERNKAKLKMDVVDEQIDTVGKTFLGLTIGCARCHDHKFDPVPTADYHALAGIFASTHTLEGEFQKYVSSWKNQPLPIEPAHAAELAAYEAEKSKLDAAIKKLKKKDAKGKEAKAKGPASPGESPALEKLLAQGIVVDTSAAKLTGSWIESVVSKPFVGKGYLRDDDKGKGEKSVRFEVTLPKAGLYELRYAYTPGPNRSAEVPIRIDHAGGQAAVTLNEQKKPTLAGLLEPLGQFNFTAEQPAVVTVETTGTSGHVLVDAVQFVAVGEASAVAMPDPVADKSEKEAEERAAKELARLEQELKELQARAPKPAPVALAVREADTIASSPIYIRGEVSQPGPVVPRGFLSAVTWEGNQIPIPETESGRRQLAEWLADPRHPLVGRVQVNRVWTWLMGEGLVRSVDNFGALGEPPTHPELLDTLTHEYQRHDWSLKWLVKEIVLSRTFAQDSAHRADGWASDPENRRWWRYPRQRMSAESLRDSLLAVSANLDDGAAGASPVGHLGKLVTENRADQKAVALAETAQRTIYQPVIRGEVPAQLMVFDFADPDFVTGQRSVTTVPAQSLLVLNSPQFADAAERVAKRLDLETTPNPTQRLDRIYHSLLYREPTSQERAAVARFLGESPNGPTAWERIVHSVLASVEFRTID